MCSREYSGTGGVSLGSFWRKLVFALRFGAYQIVLSDDIGAESRILFNRNIRERISAMAPFLRFLDQRSVSRLADGQAVLDVRRLHDEHAVSVLDAVRAACNYIRNSVKFVIDAYDGTTTAYLADTEDPIAATYAQIFPGTVQAARRDAGAHPRARALPGGHLRDAGAGVCDVSHDAAGGVLQPRGPVGDPDSRRSNERTRDAAVLHDHAPARENRRRSSSRCCRSRRAGATTSPPGSWRAATASTTARLRVFEFPKQKLVFGPRQVVARIKQDQVISPQITLWNQQGSQVIWGTLMVIPIEESLIYVRPLYLRASGGRIPELTRVIVAYENRIVMQETLEEGLAELFGGKSSPSSPSTTTAAPSATPAPAAAVHRPSSASAGLAALAAEAQSHYERAVAGAEEWRLGNLRRGASTAGTGTRAHADRKVAG